MQNHILYAAIDLFLRHPEQPPHTNRFATLCSVGRHAPIRTCTFHYYRLQRDGLGSLASALTSESVGYR